MKRITNVFLCLSLVFAFVLSAYAIPSVNEGASVCTSGTFTVSGTADAGELLMLRAIKPNGSEANPADIFYAETKYADADGNFAFEFGINDGITGNYKIIITSANASSDVAIVRGVNEADIIDVIDKINSAADAAELKSLFDSYNVAVKLSMNTDIYDRVSSDGDYPSTFGIIFQNLYDQKTAAPLSYDGTGIVNMPVFQAEFNRSSALAYLNQENSLQAITEFDTADYFNLTRAGTASASLDAYVTDKSAVKSLVAADDYTSISALQKAYDEKMLLAAIKNNDHFQINNIVNAAGVGTLLGEPFKLNDYNANPSIKHIVDISVAGQSYANVGEFIAAFNAAILQGSSPDPITPSYPNSGGGSGGSVVAGGGQVITPPYVDTRFYDLEGYDWAKEAIESLQDMNIISGIAPNTFSPADAVNREQFVKMIVLMAGKYNSSAVCTFGDVPAGDWSASYIASAVNAGLVQGIDEASFGYGREISRQDACVILARVIKDITHDGTSAEFTDSADIAPYAADAVELLSSLGIINGMDDGSFAPNDNMIRAQAAKVIYELFKVGGFADEN